MVMTAFPIKIVKEQSITQLQGVLRAALVPERHRRGRGHGAHLRSAGESQPAAALLDTFMHVRRGDLRGPLGSCASQLDAYLARCRHHLQPQRRQRFGWQVRLPAEPPIPAERPMHLRLRLQRLRLRREHAGCGLWLQRAYL